MLLLLLTFAILPLRADAEYAEYADEYADATQTTTLLVISGADADSICFHLKIELMLCLLCLRAEAVLVCAALPPASFTCC